MALFFSFSFWLLISFSAYEQSITIGKRNSDKEFKKSAALTTQAMVAYTQGDIDSCKKLLFQA